MAMRLGFLVSFLALGLMMGIERSEAANFNVGDTTGWAQPTNNDFYDNWTDNKIFRVGDTLTFTWNGLHDVAQVTEAQHESCTKVTTNVTTTSPAVITLSAIGKSYFICTISNHCQSGQELEIEVVAASTTPSPPSTTTSPSGSPSPPTTTTTTSPPPPPPPNSAGVFGPVVALSAVLSLLAFMS